MPAPRSEFELEKRARSIVGETLERVWYRTIRESPRLERDFHGVDTAVCLQTRGGKRFEVFWADELNLRHGFGIGLSEVVGIGSDEGTAVEVTVAKAWKAPVGRTVSSVQIHWRNIIDNMRSALLPMLGLGHLTRPDYPQTLELALDSGQQLFFVAMRVGTTGHPIPFTNHVTIFFRPETWTAYSAPLRTW